MTCFRSIVLLLLFFPLLSAAQPIGKSPRVVVLSEKGFPSVDGMPLSAKFMEQALDGFQVRFLSAQEIAAELAGSKTDLLITPYGSAFPKELAGTLFAYLRSGGRWMNLGGTPLAVPVTRENKNWKAEVRQTQFHKILGITQSFHVSNVKVQVYGANEEIDGAEKLLKEFSADEAYGQYVRFTSTKDFPQEDGTAGQRDVLLRPLVWGTDGKGRKMTAPFVAFDQLQGEFAGGRWVFANFKGTLSPKAFRWLAEFAFRGAARLSIQPTLACLYGEEQPSCTVQLTSAPGSEPFNTLVELYNPAGKKIDSSRVSLTGNSALSTSRFAFKLAQRTPGLYTLRVIQSLRSPLTGNTYTLTARNGFWVSDAALMKSGKKFSADGTYLLREGKPYPVTGTTYMASDVARKFLLESNPAVWDADFAAMKESGINMVRTGLWTAWKNLMLDVGVFNEAAFRSLDAFILTARKYDIPVIFSFFAFIPESWGGENAYLDPRSVKAQQAFLAAIAQRYSTVDDLIWDLINEPSFCNPKALWSCRPNYDRFENASWNEWLLSRAPLSQYQLRWRMTTGEALDLPKFEEFSDLNIFDDRRPLKVVDYRLFAQDMFRRWILQMTEALRSNGNRNQLITVGQDEGGTNDSPNNQFMGDLLGFTSMHNWWLNDDLVWDNIITRKPGVPNLLEETGVMFNENMDGSAWRTEEDAASLLERKLAISFGAGGAGFIEWIWNINPFMKSDNEATIGLHRADGTAKPELDPVAAYARFFDENKERMTGRRQEDVVMVIPHSNMFSTRNFATEATKKAIRVFSYQLGIPVAAVSEYGIDALTHPPRLIVLPAPQALKESAWQKILSLVRSGSTLLVSGAVDADEYRLPVERLRSIGIDAATLPLRQAESFFLAGKEHFLSFRNLKFQRLEKAVAGSRQEVVVRQYGSGSIVWSPLPVENADEMEPCLAWYEFGLKHTSVQPPVSVNPVHPGILVLPTVFENAILLACVSEASRDLSVAVTLHESSSSVIVTIPAQRTLLLFVDRKSGRILSRSDS